MESQGTDSLSADNRVAPSHIVCSSICPIPSGPCLQPVNAGSQGRISPIADVEQQAILGAIAQLHGDKLMAANLLGLGKTAFYRKLKKYGEIL